MKKNKSINYHNDTISMVKRLRSFMNEDVEKKGENRITKFDQDREEEKFKNFLRKENVMIRFHPLELRDNLVFWGGNVDGVIDFVFKVTSEDATSGVEFDYQEGFNPENPENSDLIKKIEDYYNIFYKYWRDELIQ